MEDYCRWIIEFARLIEEEKYFIKEKWDKPRFNKF
jgi:hypothetical protein